MISEIKLCPNGAKPVIKTREPAGRWMIRASKTVTCPCNCLRITEGYFKGGQAWRAVEDMAVIRWNAEMEKIEAGASNDQ